MMKNNLSELSEELQLRLTTDKKFLKQKKKLDDFIEKYIESIPDEHHKPIALRHLTDPSVDYLMAISNRGDGKTFGYFDFLTQIALKFEVLSIIVSRSWIVRDAYVTTYEEMFDELEGYDSSLMSVTNTRLYIMIYYDGILVSIVTDLNSVTNLKYKSTFLKKFSLIVYDEFLAIESDYLPDEFERLAKLYSSLDRNDVTDYLGIPKTIFLGNPENFASPVLSGVNIFRHLENHVMGTVAVYDNVALHMVINEKRNTKRNTRAYKQKNSSLTTGKFIVNNFNVATLDKVDEIKQYNNHVRIKLDNSMYINLYYYKNDLNKYVVLISVTHEYDVNYDFNIKLKDNTLNSRYLKTKYFNENHYKTFLTDKYLFQDTFSKDFILNDYELSSINLMICIIIDNNSKKKEQLKQLNHNQSEEYYERIRISQVKKSLFEKFGLGKE